MASKGGQDRNRQEARRWHAVALRDAELAAIAARGGYHEHACFLVQQAAEKLLKALLYRHGEGPVIGHSVVGLAKAAARYTPALGARDLRSRLKDLDAYYIPTRYPNGLIEGTPQEFYEAEDSEQALGHLATLRGLVEPMLPGEAEDPA